MFLFYWPYWRYKILNNFIENVQVTMDIMKSNVNNKTNGYTTAIQRKLKFRVFTNKQRRRKLQVKSIASHLRTTIIDSFSF